MPLSPRSRRLRKYRVQFAFGVLCLLAGAFILTVRDDLSSRLHLPAAGILGSAIVFFAYGTGVLLLMYLRGAINFGFLDSLFRVADETAEDTSRSRRPDQELAVIWSEVQRLHQQIASRTDIVLAQGEREELLSKVRTNLTSELAAELEQKYSVEYQNTAHLNEAREVFRSNAERLKQEIATRKSESGDRSAYDLSCGSAPGLHECTGHPQFHGAARAAQLLYPADYHCNFYRSFRIFLSATLSNESRSAAILSGRAHTSRHV